MILILPQTL